MYCTVYVSGVKFNTVRVLHILYQTTLLLAMPFLPLYGALCSCF